MTIENVIHDIHQLSEDEQRRLAAAILKDPKLEVLVEELEDHLSCEKAAADEAPELFKLS